MFGVPKKTQDGRYYVKPNEKKLVQLNGVKVVSVSQDSMTLSLDEACQKSLSDVDALVLSSAKENCELWFSRVVAEKTLETAYTKSFSDGTMNVSKSAHHKVYRVREVVGEEELVEGTVCDVILELSGISFTKKTYSPVWKIVQTRLKELPKKKYHEEYLFQDDEPVEEVSDDDLFA
jgi:hypothetical protein